MRALEAAEIYLTPIDDGTEALMRGRFESISPDKGAENVALEIEGREIAAKALGDDVSYGSSSPSFARDRGVRTTIIELAMIYQTVLVSNVPVFTTRKEDAARRFISLVDEFYDHGVKLVLSAAAPIPELYQGERVAFEFHRTESRLQEMQSHDYLAREHKPD
ncbi:MAG: AFG1/ZapE family ATPase [Gammaproteobacteria bacterium]|nr:AFG1/ZapE family ATPase [Gammaproteobacteria bacterium]